MIDEATKSALHGWVTRSRNERTTSTAVFDGRVLVGELASVDADTVVALVADVCALAGKAWQGRVVLRDAQGAEVVSVPLRVERAVIAAAAPSSSTGEAGELPKALADALRASTSHTHAMATLLVQTTKELAAGASALLAANEKTLSVMSERLIKAENDRNTMESMLKDAFELAQGAQKQTEEARKESREFFTVLKVLAGPQTDSAIAGLMARFKAVQELPTTTTNDGDKSNGASTTSHQS